MATLPGPRLDSPSRVRARDGRSIGRKPNEGALVLLTAYVSPKRLRRLGETRLAQWLRREHVRDSAGVAARAVAAVRGQDIELPGQQVAETIVAELPASILRLDRRRSAVGTATSAWFTE